jgi:Glycosyl hydrolase family 63 C-terminal domain
MDDCPESARLIEDASRAKNWKRWGPYLSERQWGTVREDYSANGDCWNYFPHDHARSRAYRWGEDGLLGFTDRECRLCFAPALWNGVDPILKERLFGLTNQEGNHGEDVKEAYFYLDALPTNSYQRALYKYPQRPYPYGELVEVNGRRSKEEPEYEITDTEAFAENRYFDIEIEYAKGGPDDILIQITATNRGPEPAMLHLLPILWFRNTWSWGRLPEDTPSRPELYLSDKGRIEADHATLGNFLFLLDPANQADLRDLLFTENETNRQRLYGVPNPQPFVKDAFHEAVIHGRKDAVNPTHIGTKAAAHYAMEIAPGKSWCVRLRLVEKSQAPADQLGFGDAFSSVLNQRKEEADKFYQLHISHSPESEEFRIMRQAQAGLLWSKQFYNYQVARWLKGDPGQPPPSLDRQLHGRNWEWPHVFNRDVLSMPDKWEYPWYAAWDLAFHTVELARTDPAFAKGQLELLLREWYMHPNGQIPAYEFAFSDVNPPVHAWAAWRVYKIAGARGARDLRFLESVFQKLLMNFTWWVNRKDSSGRNLFSGGFLGLDNIGVFDRSKPLGNGNFLEQADGTAWMANYCLTMLGMAMELAQNDPVYEDIASKFFEHFVTITNAINTFGGSGLWDAKDGFYYDRISLQNGNQVPLRIRSIVGLLPMIAVAVAPGEMVSRLPNFKKRVTWFIHNRPELALHISEINELEAHSTPTRMLAIPSRDQLVRMLGYMLDEEEFLSPYGIRSISRFHKDHPYILKWDCEDLRVDYTPGDSTTGLFGGNSNWRGPIWMPINYLLVEALERYHFFYGNALKVECPTGSGNMMNLREVSRELKRRLASLFLPGSDGTRPYAASLGRYANDPLWRNNLLFNEYFHGDNGRGLGAEHQTGWTALIADCLRGIPPNK